MYYFGYCTFLNDEERKKYLPEAKFVTKGYVANHKVVFHAAGNREDRGWCHLANNGDAWGHKAFGLIYQHDSKFFEEADYEDFEKCYVTVYGEDGKIYDCWTLRMSNPGIEMRPPNFYWENVPKGLNDWEFPEEYIQLVVKTFNEAKPCPDADRDRPPVKPGKSADSR